MTKETPAPVDERLCFALYSSSQAIIQKYTPLLGKIGLTYPQYLVWLSLYHGGEQSVSALGEELFLNSGTLTPLLKRMETAGHVERKRSDKDERVVLVKLTDSSAKLADEITAIQKEVVCDTGLAPGPFKVLREAIKELNRNLRD